MMIFKVLFLLFASTLVSAANAAGMMDSLVTQVQAASGGWMTTALGYATNLFFGLAAIEFAWSAIQLTLKKSELSEIMVGTLFKVMSLSFFAMILVQAPVWIPAIIDSFKIAGAGVGGTSVLSPSAVFDQGLGVASSLMQFTTDAAPSTGGMIINTLTGSGQSLGKFMLSSIIIGIASIFIIIGYGLIAVQLLITLIESYMIIGGGAIMLGFSGSRWTHNLSEKYFGYAISVGVKLFTIYLIIGFGDSFTQALKDTIAQSYANHPEGPSFGDYLGVGGASLFYGVTGYMAPGLAGSMLNGSVSMSLQNVGAAAGMTAAAPVAAGLSAGAAGARAMGLAAGGIGALMPVQKAAGAIGGSSSGGFGGGISGSLSSGANSSKSMPGANGKVGAAGSPGASGSAAPGGRSASSSASGGSPSSAGMGSAGGTSGAASPSSGKSAGGSPGGVAGKPGGTEKPGGPGAAGGGTSGQGGAGAATAAGKQGGLGAQAGGSGAGGGQGGAGGAKSGGSGFGAGADNTPGFANPKADLGSSTSAAGGGQTARNETGGMAASAYETNAAQKRFDAQHDKKPAGIADKLNDFSKKLQYAADRKKPHLVSDGSVGHAPNLRMGLDA